MAVIKGYKDNMNKSKKPKTIPQMIYKGYTQAHKTANKRDIKHNYIRIGRANPENFKKDMEGKIL